MRILMFIVLLFILATLTYSQELVGKYRGVTDSGTDNGQASCELTLLGLKKTSDGYQTYANGLIVKSIDGRCDRLIGRYYSSDMVFIELDSECKSPIRYTYRYYFTAVSGESVDYHYTCANLTKVSD